MYPGLGPEYYRLLQENFSSTLLFDFFKVDSNVFYLDRYLEKLQDHIQSHYAANPVFLMGHSYGASIALEFASKKQCPQLKGLILVSPLFNSRSIEAMGEESIDAWEHREKGWLNLLENTDIRSKFAKKKLDYFKEFLVNKSSHDVFDEVLEKCSNNSLLSESFEKSYATKFDARPCLSPDLRQSPTLAVWGNQDYLANKEHVEGYLDLFQTIYRTELHGIGHFAPIEAPSVLAFLIQDFIADFSTSLIKDPGR